MKKPQTITGKLSFMYKMLADKSFQNNSVIEIMAVMY